MKKYDLFIKAMNAQEYRRTSWVISAFSLVREAVDEWKNNPFPYRIVQTPAGNFYVNPENTTEILKIDDAAAGQPIYRMTDAIDLKANTFINQKNDIRTTYGNVLANHILLIQAFGDKIPFITGKFTAQDIERMIVPKLTKTPQDGEERSPKLIYVDEKLRFDDGCSALTAYTQLCVPAHTKKMMVVPPGTKELRDSLLAKYKDRLHDPATIAIIDKILIDHFKKWIKGDRSEGFLISKKSIEIVRKKLLLMHGAETGLTESVSVDLISNSLREGWDINKIPTMINTLRAGAFFRGQQTELGGVAVKELLRASSNIRIIKGDCGSKIGMQFKASEQDKHILLGYNHINQDNTITMIDEDNYGDYLGKVVSLRSPMYCKLTHTDYCEACMGRDLSRTPTAASIAISDYGNTFLSIYLKAAHAKSLKTKKLDWSALMS